MPQPTHPQENGKAPGNRLPSDSLPSNGHPPKSAKPKKLRDQYLFPSETISPNKITGHEQCHYASERTIQRAFDEAYSSFRVGGNSCYQGSTINMNEVSRIEINQQVLTL